jgi:prophage regulatory protein
MLTDRDKPRWLGHWHSFDRQTKQLSISSPQYPAVRTPDFLPSLSESIALISSGGQTEEMMMADRNGSPIRRTIRRQQLREMVPLADSTIYEMEQRGEFPRRFALSPRCVVWDLAEVEAWLASRRSSPVRRAQHPDVRQRHARPVRGRDQARGEASKAG